MKKIFGLFVLALGGFMLASCSEDNGFTEKVNSIQVVESQTTIPATGGTVSFTVTGYIVNAIPADGWFQAVIEDDKIIITAEPNPMRESRASHVSLREFNGDETLLSIMQYGTVLSLSENAFEISGASANLVVSVESTENAPVTVESQNDWITATYDAETGQVNIQVKANDSIDPREGTVNVISQGITEAITVKQGGLVLNVGQTEWYIKSNGVYTLRIPVERSIEVEAVAADDWLNASFNETTSQLVLTTTESDATLRTTTVTLTSGPLTLDVTVHQYGLLGSYYLLYTNPAQNNGLYYFPAELTTKALEASIFSFPVTVADTPSGANNDLITLGPSGSYLGTYLSYYLYLLFVDLEAGGYWTYHAADGGIDDATVSGSVSFEEDTDGETYQYVDFKGQFTWDDGETYYNCEEWRIGAYNAEKMAADNYAGVLARMVDPYMVKVEDAASSAAPARLAMRQGLAIKGKNGKWALPTPEKSFSQPVFITAKFK